MSFRAEGFVPLEPEGEPRKVSLPAAESSSFSLLDARTSVQASDSLSEKKVSIEKATSQLPTLDLDGIINKIARQLQFPVNENNQQVDQPDQRGSAGEIRTKPEQTKPEQAKSEHAEPEHAPDRFNDKNKIPGITRDEHGLITEIVYPGGKKSTSLERDGSGNLNAVVSRGEKGAQRFEKQGDKWYCDVEGMKLPLPGQIKVSAQGDVSTDWGSGVWQTDRLDGTSINEKTNAGGSRIALDKQGRVESIARKDGSSLHVQYDGASITKLSEAGPDGKNPTNWKRLGDAWVSDTQPSQQRLNMVVAENGNLSFSGCDGLNHIRRGNGKELIESPGQAKFSFDTQGRIAAIDYAGGKKNSFTYDGDSDKLKSISLADSHNQSCTYTRDGAGDSWTINNAGGKKIGVWKGEALIADDGTYSNRRTGKSTGKDPVEFNSNEGKDASKFWNSLRTDGQLVREQISTDGARASFDKNGNPVSIQHSDGSGVEAFYDRGSLSKLIESNSKTGERTTWTQQTDKTWRSDSAKFTEPRRNLSFDKNGDISFASPDGNKHVQRLDGSVLLSKTDGSRVDIDQQGLVRAINGTGGNKRTFDYDEKGQLTKVVDTEKSGLSSSWARSVAGESRSQVKVSPLGDLSYKNNDGSTTIERSNFLKTKLDSDGKVLDVTLPNGSSRTFSYNANKDLLGITDTRKSPKGERTETWTRQANPDGSLSDRFTTEAAKGKMLIREAVAVKQNGDYDYRGSDGKAHSSPADFLRSGSGSADVDEARAQLEDVAKNHNMSMTRFGKFMDEFEKRCHQGAEANMKVPSDEAIAKTYDSLAKLLEGRDGSFMNDNQRLKICEQTMHNIGFPREIDQGENPTCNITTGEIYTASRRPEKYADLVEQIATTGKYVYQDVKGRSHTVHPPRSGETPGNEEASFDINHPHQNSRSWASKIFQVTAVNTIEPGYSSGVPSGADIDGIIQMTKNVSGDKMPYTGYGSSGEARAVNESTLIKLKESGNLPCGVVTLGGVHVQVIHDVRIENGKVKAVWLGNQWGKENDPGWITMNKLHDIQGGGGGW